MFRDNAAWQDEVRKDVAQHWPGSPGDGIWVKSHQEPRGHSSPDTHMYQCEHTVSLLEV